MYRKRTECKREDEGDQASEHKQAHDSDSSLCLQRSRWRITIKYRNVLFFPRSSRLSFVDSVLFFLLFVFSVEPRARCWRGRWEGHKIGASEGRQAIGWRNQRLRHSWMPSWAKSGMCLSPWCSPLPSHFFPPQSDPRVRDLLASSFFKKA